MASLGLVPISQPHDLSQNEVYNAWAHYTGVPEAFTQLRHLFPFRVFALFELGK